MDEAINNIRKLVTDENELKKFADEKFDKTDVDGSGQIEITELKEVMNEIADELGYSEPSDDLVKGVLERFDKDNSGVLEKEEFKIFIKGVLETFLKAFDED